MIFVGDDKADGTKKLKHLPLQYCAISYIIIYSIKIIIFAFVNNIKEVE